MVSIYMLAALILIYAVIQFAAKPKAQIAHKKGFVKKALMAAGFIIFIGALIFPLALPIVDLPAPSGNYLVGTSSFKLTDESREELFTQDIGDKREILVNVWYPAQYEKGAKKAPYWDKDGVIGREYSLHSGMGSFWYTHLNKVETNSVENAHISDEKANYPAIIYSHSFYGLNRENTMLFEALASNGYIVFSINHSYETIISLYPDGKTVTGDLENMDKLYSSNSDREESLYLEYEKADTQQEKTRIVNEILSVDKNSEKMIEVRTKDVIFLMDELENINSQNDILKTKVNLDEIGVMGWSFGGATAMEAAMSDTRVKAAVNIDGWPYGENFATGEAIDTPTMILRSAYDDDMENTVSSILYERLRGPAYMIYIQNTEHMNFWDFPLFFKVYRYLDYWGSMDPLMLNEINSKYLLGFFNTYLADGQADFAQIQEEYPQARLETKNES